MQAYRERKNQTDKHTFMSLNAHIWYMCVSVFNFHFRIVLQTVKLWKNNNIYVCLNV